MEPELLPSSEGKIKQRTEDIVGPYELHDFFLYYYMTYRCSPSKMYRIACSAFQGVYTKEELLKWGKNFYKRFFAQQYKRSCSADGPKVFPFDLSPRGGFRFPSDADSSLWLSELDSLLT